MKIINFILIAPFLLTFYILGLVVLTIVLLFSLFSRKGKEYLKRNFIAIDQAANTLFFGYEDETISSRAGKHAAKNDCVFCNLLCKFLNLFDKNHCQKSIEYDEGEPMEAKEQ